MIILWLIQEGETIFYSRERGCLSFYFWCSSGPTRNRMGWRSTYAACPTYPTRVNSLQTINARLAMDMGWFSLSAPACEQCSDFASKLPYSALSPFVTCFISLFIEIARPLPEWISERVTVLNTAKLFNCRKSCLALRKILTDWWDKYSAHYK